MRLLSLLFIATIVSNHAAQVSAQVKSIRAQLNEAGDRVEIFRDGESQPIVTQNAKPDFRPYLHPVVAPDGKGVLTEFSPSHHKHQTGLYWGFTRLNGRDYFHHPEGDYWKRVSVHVLKASSSGSHDSVQWQTIYDLLDSEGNAVLRESQIWTMRDEGNVYLLTLEWAGQANVDVTIGQYDYGGLFLRMPWKSGITGAVTNNARQSNNRAEGQRAVWCDVGIQVEGRQDPGRIAIFDHPQNKGFPQPWRVDGQLGIGPVRARTGDWKIAKGQKEIIKHQFYVSTGALNDVETTNRWAAFSGQPMAYAQWQLAQQEGRKAEFLTPEKAVEKMTLQSGFAANVFASEPMIGQPMAFCWDAKGRMWVAENFDYETRQTGFSNDGTSRISILEDANRDGVADSKKVFLEGIPFPAAIATGMGGLWLGAPPNLLFVPDKDGDDRADMEDIEVRLTGWGIRDRHETLNSLIWGPDGWLYGLQGYATPSQVGKPKGKGKLYKTKEPFPENVEFADTPVEINGGVWRYHPTKDRFEVVSHGFSNPWGIDYDAKGQLFITACVIPHLWHVIPGGIYHRQGGTHFNPYVYSDIRTIADHSHQSAHGGARVYQSDAFPKQYQGRIFMANIHEHAILTDRLQPSGSGFRGMHGDDFLLANNAQWVGFSMEVGPDGSVYVLDWHDADICGKEVLNKDTGRVFRVAAIDSRAANFPNRYSDLNTLSDLELARMQSVPSVWHATNARIILQHRSQSREIAADALKAIEEQLQSTQHVDLRLRSLWTLHAIRKLSSQQLIALLVDSEPYIRAWSIQLLCEDNQPTPEAVDRFTKMAADDASPIVRLYLSSAVQRIEDRPSQWSILNGLSQHAGDRDDHNLPKMHWFALEPLVVADVARSLAFASNCKLPLLTRHIARRLADANKIDELLQGIAAASGANQVQLLLGLRDALEGRYDMQPPPSWELVQQKLTAAGDEPAQLALQLAQQFGDAKAAEAMIQILRDRSASMDSRRDAIQGLAGRKRPELRNMLVSLFDDPGVRRFAIRAVASYDDNALSRELLKRFAKLSDEDKLEAINAMSTRAGHGNELTRALETGNIAKKEVPAHVARLLRRVVGNRFVDVWGPIDEIGSDKEALFVKYREVLKDNAVSKADVSRGRLVFSKTCASCHKLYGEGSSIGPDLTGSNRAELEYILSNMLTPSAVIQDAYKMHLVLTDDGRIYSGIPTEENDRQLRMYVAGQNDPVTISKSQIESREISAVSMMPDGLLTQLPDTDVLDLVAYLRTQKQVELPAAANE